MKVTVEKKGNNILITATDGPHEEPVVIVVPKAQAKSLGMTLSGMADKL